VARDDGGRIVRAAQDHVRGGARRRWRIGRGHHEKSMVAGAVGDVARDLAVVVDAVGKGLSVRRGVVDIGESAVAVDEGMDAGAVIVLADDLAGIIDAIEERARREARRRIVDCRVAAAAAGIIEKTVEAEDGGIVSYDQARAIDALGKRVAIAADPVASGSFKVV
jgi:hypothetical protein